MGEVELGWTESTKAVWMVGLLRIVADILLCANRVRFEQVSG